MLKPVFSASISLYAKSIYEATMMICVRTYKVINQWAEPGPRAGGGVGGRGEGERGRSTVEATLRLLSSVVFLCLIV